MDRETAVTLLKKYNQEELHLRHGVTVEAVMRYFAEKKGEDAEFWGLAGLLHDVDFERYPEEHCVKAPELLAEIDAPEALIHAVCSHGYGIVSDVEPECEMEKILFAADELTGLIGARCTDASVEKHEGYGAEKPEEEIQRQKICGRMLQRYHQTGRRAAWLGAGYAACRNTCGNAGEGR